MSGSEHRYSGSSGRRELDEGQVTGVVRYWLAALRHEEALGRRLRVASPSRRIREWNWTVLADGPSYFKLTVRDAEADAQTLAFLLRERRRLRVELEPEHFDFLAEWVRRAYWKERGGEEGDGACVVGFPALHFRRRGQLDTLLRFTTSPPRWLDAAGRAGWMPPTRARRRVDDYPDPPGQFELSTPEDDDGGTLPFSLNLDVASRVLGVPYEDSQALMDSLGREERVTPAHMLRSVVELLQEAPVADDLEGEPLWQAVSEAVAARVQLHDVRSWPIALVHAGERISATFHVQRDLASLRDNPPHKRTTPGLWSYLSGHPAEARARPLHSLVSPKPLALGQRRTAELASAASLTAAQGPPAPERRTWFGISSRMPSFRARWRSRGRLGSVGSRGPLRS